MNRRRRRLALLGTPLAITGCADLPPTLHDNPYQRQAATLVLQYNAHHGTHVAVPSVDIGATTELAYGNDWCRRDGGCDLVLSSYWVARDPEYVRVHVLPHEVAHDVCVQTVPGCTADDHGRDFRRIAGELGLPAGDPYMESAHAGSSALAGIP